MPLQAIIRRLLWILTMLSGSAAWVCAQQFSDMRFELLDEEDGLSTHWITNMVLDSAGFVWIASRDGINRYDGNSFKVFRHNDKDPRSLLHDYLQWLYVDGKGRLWVSYPEGGISLYREDCQCFDNYTAVKNDTSGYLVKNTKILYCDDDDNVWFSGMGVGLSIFNIRTGTFTHYDLPDILKIYSKEHQTSYNSVTSIHRGHDGLYWLATANGLYSFDARTGTFSYKQLAPIKLGIPRNDYFNALLPDGNKGLWLTAYTGGLSYYDFASGRFTTYKYINSYNKFALTNILTDPIWKSGDEIWVASEDKGLGIFNIRTHRFSFPEPGEMAKSNQLPTSVLYHLLLLPNGVLFANWDNDLYKYNPNSFLFHFRNLHIASSQYGSSFGIGGIVEDPVLPYIYFATSLGNGLNVMDTRTGKLRAFAVQNHPENKASFTKILDLLLDRRGRLWVLSLDYLYEFDRKKKLLTACTNPFPTGENKGYTPFLNMLEDRDGDIWVITEKGGIHRLLPDERKLSASINRKEDGNPPSVFNIACDRHGRLWMVSEGKLYTYNKRDGRFTLQFEGEKNQPVASGIRSIVADPAGDIWIAPRGNGIVHIDTRNAENPVLQSITRIEGLPTQRILKLTADQEGNLWMNTTMGVVYMNPRTWKFRVFNQTVGMDKNTIWMNYYKTGNAFYITTPGRYCKVDFEAIRKNVALPKLFLDRVIAGSRELPLSDMLKNGVTVHPDEQFFSFDFGCIDFTNQSLNKFAYMLEDWDKDWVPCGNRRFASYTNLNGGNYTFKVRVANSEGIWGEPISIPVFIETPFYKKTWFAVCAVLLFGILIYGLYLYRVRQIEQTEKLKTAFNRQLAETRMEALRAQMNPHFIFNCLNSINRYIIKSDIKTSSLYITRFAKLIRLILDHSGQKAVALSGEMEALRLYVDMEALRFDHKFTFDITTDPDVDADNIEVPPLIVQPYVENAIWHGLLHKETDGHLTVRFSMQGHDLLCEITDNGIGRARAAEFKSKNAPTRKSVGTKLTEERLQILAEDFGHAGSQKIIDLYDAAGQPCGTTVLLTIPV